VRNAAGHLSERTQALMLHDGQLSLSQSVVGRFQLAGPLGDALLEPGFAADVNLLAA
jgi:hypothetical protein